MSTVMTDTPNLEEMKEEELEEMKKTRSKNNKNVRALKEKCMILLVVARLMKRGPTMIVVTLVFAIKKKLWKKMSYK